MMSRKAESPTGTNKMNISKRLGNWCKALGPWWKALCKKISNWWFTVTREEYELTLRVPKDVFVHQDGSLTETTKQLKFRAKKLWKHSPKHFIFKDMDGHKNELKFLKPVEYHYKKIW